MTDSTQGDGPQSGGTSTIVVNGAGLGTPLQQILMADSIQPGSQASYQLCKTIYVSHVLGAKMVDTPIKLAMSQDREITIPAGPNDHLVKAFKDQWTKDLCDSYIYNTARLARMYGISSVASIIEGVPSTEPVDYKNLWKQTVSYNVLDSLNTAGSMVTDQNPNSPDFQKVVNIAISGTTYHRSRAVVMMNEDPLYIEYESSAFGFTGRSVYQRALYPLKTYIQTMVTDQMVTFKVGLLVAFLKQIGSTVTNMMAAIAGVKRNYVKVGQTGNIVSMQEGEALESIDMQNLDAPATMARKNTLENIATASDMPAQVLNHETFAEGFGEGTEDAKKVAAWVETVRKWMGPLYVYFDRATMHRAWNPDFYLTIQELFPEEYGGVEYDVAFTRWEASFSAVWPSLIREPESEKIKVEDVKLRAIIAKAEVLLTVLDPYNKAKLIENLIDTFNEMKILFPEPQEFDPDLLLTFLETQIEQQQQMAESAAEEKPPKPAAFNDSAASHELALAMTRLVPPPPRDKAHAA